MLATQKKPTRRLDRRLNQLLDQLAPSAPTSSLDRDWERAARELGRQETDYLYNEAFLDPAQMEAIVEAEPMAAEPEISTWKPGRDMPAHLARMCETSLLKPSEEANLFRRMNYLKYRADLLRRRLDPRAPDRELIVQIERLLSIARWDRNRIVRANLRLVVSIAKKFSDLRNSFDDLLSEGITSLLRAVEKFDYSRGFRFSTYATQAVRRTLCRHLQTSHRDRSRFLTAEASLFEETPEDDTPPTITEVRWEELRSTLVRLLGRLDARERTIIRNRFGLGNTNQVQTLQALAADLGVCKERVRQLEMRAISKLRSMAEAVRLAPPEETV
jgi:RNA polymerase primary sigma factor